MVWHGMEWDRRKRVVTNLRATLDVPFPSHLARHGSTPCNSTSAAYSSPHNYQQVLFSTAVLNRHTKRQEKKRTHNAMQAMENAHPTQKPTALGQRDGLLVVAPQLRFRDANVHG